MCAARWESGGRENGVVHGGAASCACDDVAAGCSTTVPAYWIPGPPVRTGSRSRRGSVPVVIGDETIGWAATR